MRKTPLAEAQTALGKHYVVGPTFYGTPVPTASSHKISLKADNFKQIHIWSRGCHRVPSLHLCTKFHQNGMIFVKIWRFHDFRDGGSLPSWILRFNNGYFEKPMYFHVVVNRDHSSKVLSFWESRAFCTHFGDRRTDERTDGQTNRWTAPMH